MKLTRFLVRFIYFVFVRFALDLFVFCFFVFLFFLFFVFFFFDRTQRSRTHRIFLLTVGLAHRGHEIVKDLSE